MYRKSGDLFGVSADSIDPYKCWDYSYCFEQVRKAAFMLLLTDVVTLILCVSNYNFFWIFFYKIH